MSSRPMASGETFARDRFVVSALLLATAIAYARTLDAPFVFDDLGSIVANPSLSSFRSALFPPAQLTVSGRPLLNLSLALNHAISGTNPWSYHLLNLAIHAANGLLLLGIVQRTLAWRADVSRGISRHSNGTHAVAGSAAALWLLHPVQTEAVTYIVQRAESLMAFCALATLYSFARSVDAPRPQRWQAVSLGCCVLGMAAKEVMAPLPLLVLLYDRAFVSGTWRAAWTARRGLYLGYASTWSVLAALVLGTPGRGETAGFATELSPWSYVLTQAPALVIYVRQALWPDALVFDYGTSVTTRLAAAALPGLLVLTAVAATVWGVVRNRPLGFIGAWWFAILAPSSSFVPIATQTMAEHRIYLPSAGLAALGAIALQRALGHRAMRAGLAVSAGLLAATVARNEVYRDDLALWCDVVAKRPSNPRGHAAVAAVLGARGRFEAALPYYRAALQLAPDDADIHFHCAETLARLGRFEESLPHYAAATQSAKASPEAHCNYGSALARMGRATEALGPLNAALRQRPDYPEALGLLGAARLQLGEPEAAIASLEGALRLQPGMMDARANLGLALLYARRFDAARLQFENLLAAHPGDIRALNNLAYLALQQGDAAGAVRHYATVARRQPADPRAHFNLAVAQARNGDRREAIEELETALRLQPDFTEARRYLGQLRANAAP